MRARLLAAAAALATATLAAPAAAVTENLGVNTHIPTADELDMAKALGVTWVRVDAVWRYLEPAEGQYDWGSLDPSIEAASARGLSVYLGLGCTADWVPRARDVHASDDPCDDEPATEKEWERFVEALVAHYRPMGVRVFGLWNEPNIDHFWEAGAPEYVAKILVPGAHAVRAACADCTVAAPDLAASKGSAAFLETVLSQAKWAVDLVTVHTYRQFPETGLEGAKESFLGGLVEPTRPWSEPAVKQVLDAQGYTGEVWLTETGYLAEGGGADVEATQATYVRRVLEEQRLHPFWTNTFFYELLDCKPDQPACDIDGFGLARANHPRSEGPRSYPEDYRTKPAFDAVTTFVAENPWIQGGELPPLPPGSGGAGGAAGAGDGAGGDGRGIGASPVDGEGDAAAPSSGCALGGRSPLGALGAAALLAWAAASRRARRRA